MYDHSARFLRVIMSSLCALCCLLSVQKQEQFFFVQCIIKQLLDLVFVISRIIKLSVDDNPYLDLDYSGYHKNLIQ